jgi:hypothetical protein
MSTQMILTKLLLRIYLSMLQDGMTNPEHFIPRSEDCAAMSITFGMPDYSKFGKKTMAPSIPI